MKKLKDFLMSVLYPSCLYFTAICFVFAIIGTAAGALAVMPKLSDMALWFLFSFFMAYINKIFKTSLNSVLKVSIHFFGSLAAFILVFLVLNTAFNKTTGGVVVACVMFVLAYLLVLSVIMLVRSLTKKKKNEKSNYKNQFN